MSSTQAEKKIITSAGLKKLEAELEDLKVNRRRDIAQKIKEAREQGDTSENAEYDAALEEQGEIEARIDEIESILKNSEAAPTRGLDGTKVNVGSLVRIRDLGTNELIDYTIVGSAEASSLKGFISNESPVGAALLGHKKGDEVDVETPGGVMRYRVVRVERA